MKRVVVGLSGGVDSSVAAYLLKEQGYEVIGLFMKNWHDDSVTISDECPWLEDSNDAMLVAQKLNIPFQTVDLSEEYKERIVDYMFREYEKGRTPNPDVLCNREIKFDVFLKIALDLGADYVATGHYCRKDEIIQNGETTYRLLAGKDTSKDQSYLLCQLSQDMLAKTLFPIGEIQKTKEGKIIEEAASHDKYQMNGAPKNFDNLHDKAVYHSQKYEYQPTEGKVVGTHIGAHFFTKGQRKGLAVGGTKEPLFVIETDVKENIIYAGQGKDHPGLHRKALLVHSDEVHWIRPDLALELGETMEVQARIRYRQPLCKAQLYRAEEGTYVLFEESQTAITEGQFVAWYLDDELIGSGVIG